MYRFLFFCLLMLNYLVINAQYIPQTIGAKNTLVKSLGNFGADSTLSMPKRLISDTRPRDTGSIYYRISDSAILKWTGNAWRNIVGARQLNDSMFVLGNDTITIRGTGGGGSGISGLTAGRVVIATGATTVGDDAGFTFDAPTNKITADSVRSIKNIPDTVHIGLFERNKADTAVFFGTSITAGTDASSPAKRYTNLVAAWLRVGVINGGLGGFLLQKSPTWPLSNTFIDVYATEIPIKRPGLRYLFFAWGENDATNDQLYHSMFQVDTSYFKRDYVVIINYALSRGWSLSDIVMISPFYQTTGSASLLIQQNYYNAGKHIADSLGVKWADVFTQGKSYNTLILNDNIHPSDYGHALAADAIIKQLSQQLQVDNTENFVNAGSTILNTVKIFGQDTASAGYQLAAINADRSLATVPAERFLILDNDKIPRQQGNVSVFGHISAGKAIRASGFPTYTTGSGFEIYYSGGHGFLFPYDRDAATNGNVFMPASRLIVGGSTPTAPFARLYVNGTGYAQGLFSSGNGNVLYNSDANETTLNMLVSGDSVGHITTYSAAGYRRIALNGTSTLPVTIGSLADNSSGAMLQVTGKLSVSNHTIASNSDSAIVWNRSTKAYEVAKISGGSSYTFSNGLTESGGTAKWGGSLTENTTISSSNATYKINITGVNTGQPGMLNATTSGNGGVAITGTATTGYGLHGVATGTNGRAIMASAFDGTGVFSSATGVAFHGESTSGKGLEITSTFSATNSLSIVNSYAVQSAGTAANGIGGINDFLAEMSNGSNDTAARITWEWTNATAGSQTGALKFWTKNNAGNIASRFQISGDGQIIEAGYGNGTYSVTPATTPVYSSTGVKGERIAPKIYTALLSQSGTGAPTAAVLGTNEIGSIVWTRSSTGVYVGTLSSAFTSNKTWLICQKGDGSGSFVNGLLSSTSANTVSLSVTDNAGSVTDNFTNMSIEIRVYP